MNLISKWISIFVFLICLNLAMPQKAYAYLDPGSGSYILQLILAGLLAASFTLKTFWKKIWLFLKSLFSKRSKDEKK